MYKAHYTYAKFVKRWNILHSLFEVVGEEKEISWPALPVVNECNKLCFPEKRTCIHLQQLKPQSQSMQ